MIETKLLIMRSDQPHETMTVKLSQEPTYDTLAKLIEPLLGCRHMEHVTVLSDYETNGYQPHDMFVDEDGIAKGLPRNEAATVIYRRATMVGRTGLPVPSNPEILPAIYGPAILFSRIVWT